jgi:ribosomal protein S18 acetylase RimI-like enzyme
VVNMMFKYRPAEKEDCAKLAELINIASGGIMEYLFHDLVTGTTPVQVVARNLESENSPYSYRSAIVAAEESDVMGMALSFPSSYHKITNTMRNYFPADRMEHLRHFYTSRVEDSWLLDALCVIESHRRRGVGEKLISLTKEKAVENGCRTLSLITFADNDLAIPFYKRTGFEIVEKVELRGNEFIKHEGGCLLMNCEFIT